MALQVEERFKSLIQPLTEPEFKRLEESILEEGIRDALVIWKGNNILVDGHNRYNIAQKHDIDFEVTEKEFEDELAVEIWIIKNQLARRNLNDAQAAECAFLLKDKLLKKGRKKISETTKSKTGNQYTTTKEKFNKLENLEALSINDKASNVTDTLTKPEEKKHNTQKEIANELGWSQGKVAQAEYVKKNNPEKWNEAMTKNVSIGKVYKEVKKEEKEKERKAKEVEKKRVLEELSKAEENPLITEIEKGWHKVGKHYLYCGSNLDDEFIEELPKAKLAFADPPYNAGVDDWDKDFKWKQDYLENIADVVAVTPGGWNAFNFYNETGMKFIWEVICWIKNGMTHGKCGYANYIKTSLFGNAKPKIPQDLFTITIKTSETDDTKHKGRKPYDYMFHIIDLFTKERDVIIDPFAGSGTTLLMAEEMNRISYNAEIRKDYCIEIINRAIERGCEYERIGIESTV